MALLFALLGLVKGTRLKDCLEHEVLRSLPPSVEEPARQLERLLDENQFLKHLNTKYKVDQKSGRILESLTENIEEIIHQSIQSLGDGPTPRKFKDLPPSLRLLSCLANIAPHFSKKLLGFGYALTYLAMPSATSDRFYVSAKRLGHIMESIQLVVKAMLSYWAHASRPLQSPETIWLVPYKTIALEIQPLYKMALEDGKALAEGLRAMLGDELERLEQDVQDAAERMGRAFVEFHSHLDSTDAGLAGGLIDDLRITEWRNARFLKNARALYTVGEQHKRVAMSLGHLLASYSLQTLHLQLLRPNDYLDKAKNPGGNSSDSSSSSDSEDSLEESMQETFSRLVEARAKIAEACKKIIDCHEAHPGNFAELQGAVDNLQISFKAKKPIKAALFYAKQWLKTHIDLEAMSSQMIALLEKSWVEAMEMVRAIDAVLSLAMGQADKDQRNQLLLCLLLEKGKFELYWLLPWVRAFLFTIEKGIPVPKGMEYSWDNSPIMVLVRSMEQRTPTKSARNRIAVATESDQATCPEPQDGIPAPEAKSKIAPALAPESVDGKL